MTYQPLDFGKLRAAIDDTTALLDSTFRKVMTANPTWAELDDLLTVDERALFDAFVAWRSSMSDSGHPQVPK